MNDGRIALDRLNTCGRDEFVAALAGVFEHAPWVAAAAQGRVPFASVAAVHEALVGAVRAAPREQQLAFVRSHPELGSKVAQAGDLTAESKAEQGSLGLDRLSAEEFARFQKLNTSYSQKFGFPFIMAVKGRSKAEIMAAFEERLEHETDEEFDAAIVQIELIALLRLKDRLPSLADVFSSLA